MCMHKDEMPITLYSVGKISAIVLPFQWDIMKFRKRETLNLSACGDNSTNIKRNPKQVLCQVMDIPCQVFNRPGVAGAVLQSPPSLIN